MLMVVPLHLAVEGLVFPASTGGTRLSDKVLVSILEGFWCIGLEVILY